MVHSFQYGLLIAWLCAAAALVLFVVAINTDNWIVYDVEESVEIRLAHKGFPYAYDRSMGLFRECFVGDFPPPKDILQGYKTAFGKRCLNVIGRWLYPRSEIAQVTQVRIHSQTVWAQLITGGSGVVSLLIGLTVGFAAWCVNFPPALIVTTGSCFLISLTLAATAIGLWHAGDYMRQDSIQLDGYYANWPGVIKDATRAHYDWSYMAAWSGAICLLLASLLQLICYCIAKSDSEDAYNRKMMSLYRQRRRRDRILPSIFTGTNRYDNSQPPPRDLRPDQLHTELAAADIYSSKKGSGNGRRRKHRLYSSHHEYSRAAAVARGPSPPDGADISSGTTNSVGDDLYRQGSGILAVPDSQRILATKSSAAQRGHKSKKASKRKHQNRHHHHHHYKKDGNGTMDATYVANNAPGAQIYSGHNNIKDNNIGNNHIHNGNNGAISDDKSTLMAAVPTYDVLQQQRVQQKLQNATHLQPIYESNDSVHGKGEKHGPKPVDPNDLVVVHAQVPRRN